MPSVQVHSKLNISKRTINSSNVLEKSTQISTTNYPQYIHHMVPWPLPATDPVLAPIKSTVYIVLPANTFVTYYVTYNMHNHTWLSLFQFTYSPIVGTSAWNTRLMALATLHVRDQENERRKERMVTWAIYQPQISILHHKLHVFFCYLRHSQYGVASIRHDDWRGREREGDGYVCF